MLNLEDSCRDHINKRICNCKCMCIVPQDRLYTKYKQASVGHGNKMQQGVLYQQKRCSVAACMSWRLPVKQLLHPTPDQACITPVELLPLRCGLVLMAGLVLIAPRDRNVCMHVGEKSACQPQISMTLSCRNTRWHCHLSLLCILWAIASGSILSPPVKDPTV